MEIETAADRLAELGHPSRLAAFRLLVRAGPDGLTVGEIQRNLGIRKSTFTHHLDRLARVGLIEQTREGRQIRCRARFEVMEGLIGFLADECCTGVAVARDESPAAPCPVRERAG